MNDRILYSLLMVKNTIIARRENQNGDALQRGAHGGGHGARTPSATRDLRGVANSRRQAGTPADSDVGWGALRTGRRGQATYATIGTA